MLPPLHANARPDPAAASRPTARDVLELAINVPDLPEITITTQDAMRLRQLIGDLFPTHDRRIAFLARELDRASVVDPAEIRAAVVTMRSLVEFWSGVDGRLSRAMLVYPAEADVSENKISILTSVGTALLGVSEGQSMPYEGAGGSIRRLSVNRVLFQPEAEGMGWL